MGAADVALVGAEAAGDDDPAVRGQRLADRLEALGLGAVEEAAGVDDHRLGAGVVGRDGVALGAQPGQDALAVDQRLGAAEADHADARLAGARRARSGGAAGARSGRRSGGLSGIAARIYAVRRPAQAGRYGAGARRSGRPRAGSAGRRRRRRRGGRGRGRRGWLSASVRSLGAGGGSASRLQQRASTATRICRHDRGAVAECTGTGMRISSGSPFEAEFAYSRAVVKGDWCFVAGTTGYDYATHGDAARRRSTRRGRPSRRSRGRWPRPASRWRDIVRVQYTITDPALRFEVAPALREALGAGAAGGDDGGRRAERAGDEDRDRGDGVSRVSAPGSGAASPRRTRPRPRREAAGQGGRLG